jgi:hypothetical protein
VPADALSFISLFIGIAIQRIFQHVTQSWQWRLWISCVRWFHGEEEHQTRAHQYTIPSLRSLSQSQCSNFHLVIIAFKPCANDYVNTLYQTYNSFTVYAECKVLRTILYKLWLQCVIRERILLSTVRTSSVSYGRVLTSSVGATDIVVEDKRGTSRHQQVWRQCHQPEKRDAHTFFSQSIDHRSTCRTYRTRVFQPLPNSTSFTSLSEQDIGLVCPKIYFTFREAGCESRGKWIKFTWKHSESAEFWDMSQVTVGSAKWYILVGGSQVTPLPNWISHNSIQCQVHI